MAHRLSIQNGKAEMAYAGDTPWHGLGTRVDGLQTAAAMLTAAGMDWTVSTREVFLASGAPVPGFRAVCRDDNNESLGVVSDRYMPIQNGQAGDIMDALVTEGGAHVEVAGALDGGRRCWMLARIPADFEVVKGDPVAVYGLFAWGHDGKHGLVGMLTGTRVVCHNTLSAAGLGDGAKWSEVGDVYIRHSKNARIQIDDARKAMGLMKKQTEDMATAFRALAATAVSDAQAADYFTTVFPEPARGEQMTDRARSLQVVRWNERQGRLAQAFAGGIGQDIPGVRGTAWAAYNAVTEYIDHVYPVTSNGSISDARRESIAFGAYADVRERALLSALEMVN